MDNSIIKKWGGYFHDGDFINIKHTNNDIEISMESSEIFPEDLLEVSNLVELSNKNRIKGKLHLEGIKSIQANDVPLKEFKKSYDSGEISDLDLKGNTIELGLMWINYPPKPRIHDYVNYVIEAEKIYWENIPDLYNPSETSD